MRVKIGEIKQLKKYKKLKNFQKMLAKAILRFIIIFRVKSLGLFFFNILVLVRQLRFS